MRVFTVVFSYEGDMGFPKETSCQIEAPSAEEAEKKVKEQWSTDSIIFIAEGAIEDARKNRTK